MNKARLFLIVLIPSALYTTPSKKLGGSKIIPLSRLTTLTKSIKQEPFTATHLAEICSERLKDFECAQKLLEFHMLLFEQYKQEQMH